MASTQQLTGDANTVKLYAESLTFLDMYKKTSFGNLASNGGIYVAKELNGSRS